MLDFPNQIDYMIEKRKPKLVDFIDGCLQADFDDDFKTKILFINYVKFKNDHVPSIKNIFDFFC